MKTYITNGYEYFYDKSQKQWVLYPIDDLGNRIEWEENDNPIEAIYFNNRKELNKWMLTFCGLAVVLMPPNRCYSQ